MIWFPLSLGAAVSWSISQIFLKKGLENISPLWSNIINNCMTLILWVPAALILSNFSIAIPDIKIIILIMIAASLYLIFLYALSKGKVSLLGTVVSIYPVWTIILSRIFLNESINNLQKLCISLIIISSITISLPEKNSKFKMHDYQWVIWGFSASILIGTGDFISKFSINQIGVYNYIFYLSLFSNVVSVFNYILDKKSRKLPMHRIKLYIPTFIGTAISLVGSFQFQLAFQYGKASLVTPVSSTFPALTVILAIKFLNEKLTKRQLIAVGITVIGLILMGISVT